MNTPRIYTPAEYAALPNCPQCGRRLIYPHAWYCPRNPQPKPDPAVKRCVDMLTGRLPIEPDYP